MNTMTTTPLTTSCPRWCAGDHTTLLGDDDASVVTVHRHVTTDAADPFTVAVEVWTGEVEAAAGVYVDAPAADNLTPAQARASAAGLVEAAALVEAWHALAEDGPGVLLSQWLDTDPEGLPSLVGVQPVTNGSGRHIGTRYVLTVEAAQGLRDALAASEAVTR